MLPESGRIRNFCHNENPTLHPGKDVVAPQSLDHRAESQSSIFMPYDAYTMTMSSAALQEAFDEFDKDRDGYITSSELMDVMTSLRQNVSDKEIHQMIRSVDTDGKGKVSFEGFVSFMMSRQRQQSVTEEEMLEAFHVFDSDGDGYITGEDIRKTMRQLGEELSEADIKDMITEADLDKDGRINFSEFVILMQHRFIKSGQVLDSNGAFTPHQKGELRIIFSLFDKDHDNNISMDEVMQVMEAMGQQPDVDRLLQTFQLVDLDGNGLIDFNEFVQMVEYRVGRQSEDAEMRALFAAFDKDGNGYIDAKELKLTMAGIGMPVSTADVKEMLREAGVTSKHGRIYYEDFLKMMTGQIGEKQRSMATLGSSDADSASLISDDGKVKHHEDTSDVKVAFAMFDKDGDGVITCSEVLQVMVSLGIDVDSDEVKEIVRKIDLDGNGVIQFGVFGAVSGNGVIQFGVFGTVSGNGVIQFGVFGTVSGNGVIQFGVFGTVSGNGVIQFGVFGAVSGNGVIQFGVFGNGVIQFGVFGAVLGNGVSQFGVFGAVLGNGVIQFGVFGAVSGNGVIQFGVFGNGVIQFGVFGAVLGNRVIQFGVFGAVSGNGVSQFGVFGAVSGNGVSQFGVFGAVSGNGVIQFGVFGAVSGNGVIEFGEFAAWAENHKSLTHQPRETGPDEQEMMQLFHVFDKDGDGSISARDLGDTMKDLGLVLTRDDTAAMMREAGLGPNGNIHYKEFCKMMCPLLGDFPSPQSLSDHPATDDSELRVMFMEFDQDQDGLVGIDEVRRITHALGHSTSEAILKNHFNKLDDNGNGLINYPEFLQLLREVSAKNLSHSPTPSASSRHSPRAVPRPREQDIPVGPFYPSGKENVQEDRTEEVRTNGTGRECEPPVEPIQVNGITAATLHSTPPLSCGSEDDPLTKELKTAFLRFSQTTEGAITSAELRDLLQSLSYDTRSPSLREMLEQVDIDGGHMTMDEFLQAMPSQHRTRSVRQKHHSGQRSGHRSGEKAGPEPEAWKAFKFFDRDHNGYITMLELRQTMKDMGTELSDEEVQLMMHRADTNGDGKIDYKEFIRMVQSNRLVKQVAIRQQSGATSAPSQMNGGTGDGMKRTPSSKSDKAPCGEGITPETKAPETNAPPSNAANHQEVFERFDPTCTGRISVADAITALNSMGIACDSTDVKDHSSTGNGTIDFKEFLAMMKRSAKYTNFPERRKKTLEKEMRTAFKVFDINGDGLIDNSELKLTMESLGETVTTSDVQAMIQAADRDGDGKIDYEEFIRMMCNSNMVGNDPCIALDASANS
ncbi:putative calmodulin-like protein 2 [Lamellibrachia satsuma]|nr:putative calmodulin-like protein 2 [Lamellibrachia satsuma]